MGPSDFVGMSHRVGMPIFLRTSREEGWLAPNLFLTGDRDLDHGAVRDGFRDRQAAFAVLFGLEQDLQGTLQVVDRPIIEVGAELIGGLENRGRSDFIAWLASIP